MITKASQIVLNTQDSVAPLGVIAMDGAAELGENRCCRRPSGTAGRLAGAVGREFARYYPAGRVPWQG